MRPLPLAAALLALTASAARGQPVPAPAPLEADPVLARLVEESLAARPELRQAEAGARAERERVPQAGALPDPILTLGIQNDGFQEINIGKMETSYWQVMVTQLLPWPGKLGFRADAAGLEAKGAGAALDRVRLTVEADVRRAYLDLLLSRDRLLELANARDAEAFDRAIDLRIMRIRRKIEPDPAHPSVIRTVRGGGYLFSPTGETSSLE